MIPLNKLDDVEKYKNHGTLTQPFLDKDYIYQGKTLSIDELQIINNALSLLQKQNANVDQKLLHSLLNKFSLPSNKESFYEQWK